MKIAASAVRHSIADRAQRRYSVVIVKAASNSVVWSPQAIASTTSVGRLQDPWRAINDGSSFHGDPYTRHPAGDEPGDDRDR